MIIPLYENFTRDSVSKDSEFMYLFTDNAGRTSGKNYIPPDSWYVKKYGAGCFSTMTQAVIRGLPNAFPITTMVNDKRLQWNDAMFGTYKDIIDDEIAEILKASKRFIGLKFAAQMPFGAGAISNMKVTAPKIWEYMNKKLLEIQIDNSGEKPKVKN